MKPKVIPLLEHCIETGIQRGWNRAFKHDDVPPEDMVRERIREAILRELNREGQVFYLYNRIMTIEQVGERLAQVAPEARVRIAHGRIRDAKTLALQLLNFGVLVALLVWFGGRAVNKMLAGRHQQIKTDIAEAARLRAEGARVERQAGVHVGADVPLHMLPLQALQDDGGGWRSLVDHGGGNLVLHLEYVGHRPIECL